MIDFPKVRIGVFGCKSTTLEFLKFLIESFQVETVITLSPEVAARYRIAGYYDLSAFCKEWGINCIAISDYALKTEADIEDILRDAPEIAFAMGWQRIIPLKILNGIKFGVYGMHGSSLNLPYGRGRSPLNWSIIEGRKSFYTNLFKYNERVDAGAVVDTYKFQITERDTAETLHLKNLLAMKVMVATNIHRLINEDLELGQQKNEQRATYYPKRNPEDGLINWEWDVNIIERFIRAITKPFDGAFSYYKGNKFTIWDAQVFDVNEFGFRHAHPATVVEIFENGKFLIKCLGGLLLINSFKYEGKEKVECGSRLDNNEMTPRLFKVNSQMGFDNPGIL